MILWSAGIESTTLMKWFLENTAHEVVAHHIHLHNPEDRDINETNAINALRPELEKIRSFMYTESFVSICDGRVTPLDREIYHSIGTMAMLGTGCTQLYKGYCAEDQWSRPWKFINGIKQINYVRANSLDEAYMDKASVTKAFLPEHLKFEDVIQIHETAYWTKARHVSYLGDLLKYTWSCRTPINETECGKCHSCLERNAAIRGTSYIPEVARRMK